MNEFELIDLIVDELQRTAPHDRLLIGPGDDASLVAAPAGESWVSTIDAVVPDVHFPAGAPADLIGYRAMAIAVSDLAAMGAAPSHVVISLTMTEAQPEWVRLLARGFAAAAADFDIDVAGGNLARGPLNIAVSAHGHVPPELALRRDGAVAGDLVFVTGPLGLAASALRTDALGSVGGLGDLQPDTNVCAYFKPQPRLDAGVALRGVASSAIDISDGVLADAGHIAAASGVRLDIDASALPLGSGAKLEDALAGDVYELLFTAPDAPDGVHAIVIGRVVAGSGVALLDADIGDATRGYQHFDDD